MAHYFIAAVIFARDMSVVQLGCLDERGKMRLSKKPPKSGKIMLIQGNVHEHIYVSMSPSVKVPNSFYIPLNRNQRNGPI